MYSRGFVRPEDGHQPADLHAEMSSRVELISTRRRAALTFVARPAVHDQGELPRRCRKSWLRASPRPPTRRQLGNARYRVWESHAKLLSTVFERSSRVSNRSRHLVEMDAANPEIESLRCGPVRHGDAGSVPGNSCVLPQSDESQRIWSNNTASMWRPPD